MSPQYKDHHTQAALKREGNEEEEETKYRFPFFLNSRSGRSLTLGSANSITESTHTAAYVYIIHAQPAYI